MRTGWVHLTGPQVAGRAPVGSGRCDVVRGSASGTSYPVPAPRSSLARRWLVEEPRTMQDALLQGSNGGHLQKPELRLYAQRFWLAFVFCACA